MTPTEDMMLATTGVSQDADRLTAVLRQSAQGLGACADKPHLERRAFAELSVWLRVLGWRAEARVDHVRVMDVPLRWEGGLWRLGDACGARDVAEALVGMAAEPAPVTVAPEYTAPRQVWRWEDGTELTSAELRAWCRA